MTSPTMFLGTQKARDVIAKKLGNGKFSPKQVETLNECFDALIELICTKTASQ